MNLLQHASTFNPNGSLSSTEENIHKNKQNKLQKVKVKKTNLSSTITIEILGILLKMQSPWLLAKCPSHPLNANMLQITILLLIKLDPSHHNSSFPPGLRLPGCSPPLQFPGPGHFQAGGPPSWLLFGSHCFTPLSPVTKI